MANSSKVLYVVLFLFISVGQLKASTANDNSSGWLTVTDANLELAEGSALDFSSLKSITPDRYLCASYTFDGPTGFFPEYERSKKLVKQIRMHGYNMVRIHFLDNALMRSSQYDFDINQHELDKFFFFFTELKRNGIKVIMDLSSSNNAMFGDVGKNRWKKGLHNFKQDLYFNEEARLHWKKLTNLILLTKNPYTKTAMVNDSNLYSITLVNEGGIGFINNAGYSKGLIQNYNIWAKTNNKPFIKAKDFPGRWEWVNSHKAINEFLTHKERELFHWMSEYVVELGFRGYISNFNNGNNLQAYAARDKVSLVSMHSYPDLPSMYVRPGSRIKNLSTIGENNHFITRASMARRVDVPFILEEYDYPYWSEFRREIGLTVPAYAALQDWTAICRHGNPVALSYDSDIARQKAIFPLGIDMDPVARAGETLAALLFRRGDVKTSSNSIGIKFEESDFNSWKASSAVVGMNYKKIALISKVSVLYPDQICEGFDLCFNVSDQDKIKWHQVKNQLNNSIQSLPPIDDKGVKFISDTNQIFQNSDRQLFKVITPFTEAVSFDTISSSKGITLKEFHISKSSSAATISISSLDSKPLNSSERLLLIIATDAKNSDELRSLDGLTLVRHGRLPVLIKSVNLTMTFNNINGANMLLYALSLNGERRERVPIEFSEGRLHINIDFSRLKKGPTTFFEIVLAP